MTHVKYRVSNRLAVAQLKYQVRRFLKQAAACGTDDESMLEIGKAATTLIATAGGSVECNEDGVRVKEDE